MFHILFKKTYGWVLLIRQHSKTILVELNPPQSWLWKQKVNTVMAAVMILKVMNNWRSMLQINILKKKVRLWTLITFCYRKCMLPVQYLIDWCLHAHMGIGFEKKTNLKGTFIWGLKITNVWFWHHFYWIL